MCCSNLFRLTPDPPPTTVFQDSPAIHFCKVPTMPRQQELFEISLASIVILLNTNLSPLISKYFPCVQNNFELVVISVF